MKIVFEEETKEAKIFKEGDVIKLRFGAFKRYPGNQLVDSNHRFVVVSNNGDVCPLSSVMDKVTDKFPWNIEIKDWKKIGLKKPSHVKVDQSGHISDMNIFEITAELSDQDKSKVLSAYKNAPQSIKLEWISD